MVEVSGESSEAQHTAACDAPAQGASHRFSPPCFCPAALPTDLVGLAGRLDGPTLLIGGILVLAFIYWEASAAAGMPCVEGGLRPVPRAEPRRLRAARLAGAAVHPVGCVAAIMRHAAPFPLARKQCPHAAAAVPPLAASTHVQGGILLQELRERQRRQSERQRRQRRSSSIFDSWGGEDEGGADGVDGWDGGAGDEALQAEQQEQRRQQRQTRLDRARFERRRGLGWLALVTATAIWLTGVGNLQP